MKTVRSCSVSARPLQVRHASGKSPPEVEYALLGRLDATSATYRIWERTARRTVSGSARPRKGCLQASELVSVKQRKNQLRDVGG